MTYEEQSESEKYILLKNELEAYLVVFEEAYTKVQMADITEFPILVLHQQTIDMGIPIIQIEENGGNWNVHISWMEEFITKKLIRPERVEEFQALYNRKKEQYCLFVLSNLGANFIFIPRIKNIE